MTLSGTLVEQVTIKSDGDVFHDISKGRPHHIPEMSPNCIQNVVLHEGEWGAVGSIIGINYTHDGKAKVSKEVIESIDEEKKSVCYRFIGGDILEEYKTFMLTVHVDTKGEENLVTWTFHYEKLNENVDDPNSFMEFCIALTKDIENHHLPKPT